MTEQRIPFSSEPEVQGCLYGSIIGGLIVFFGGIFPWIMAGSTRGNWFTWLLTDGHCWTLAGCAWVPR